MIRIKVRIFRQQIAHKFAAHFEGPLHSRPRKCKLMSLNSEEKRNKYGQVINYNMYTFPMLLYACIIHLTNFWLWCHSQQPANNQPSP